MKRHPDKDIVEVVSALAEATSLKIDLDMFANSFIEDMNDGSMGSFRVIGNSKSMGRPAAECMYEDEDGQSVLISLYLDDEFNVKEVDFWKYDFSPLIRMPALSDIRDIKAIPM